MKKVLLSASFLVVVLGGAIAADPTVYGTKTGHKYHAAGCQYLRKSSIPMKLSAAIKNGLTPCSKCNPPTAVAKKRAA